jgi:hypothetical protein
MITDEEFEDIQSEAGDLDGQLDEAKDHLSSATSCETRSDLRANLTELRQTLTVLLAETTELWKRAGGRPVRRAEKPAAS